MSGDIDWIGYVQDAHGAWGILFEDGTIDADSSWSGAPVDFVPLDEVPLAVAERHGDAYRRAMKQAGISVPEES